MGGLSIHVGVSPLVHGLLAWLLACLLSDRPLDRRLIVIAGLAADVDGVFALFNADLFLSYHHTFGHSFVFGLPIAVVAASLVRRWRIGAGALAAFALHLLADVVGSSWAVQPFYPLSSWGISADPTISSTTIYLVLNPIVAALVIGLAGLVMYRREISPFEVLSLRLDRYAVYAWVYVFKHRCESCGRRALARCGSCGRTRCAAHLASFWRLRCVDCSSPV